MNLQNYLLLVNRTIIITYNNKTQSGNPSSHRAANYVDNNVCNMDPAKFR